jgi:hypothetical protein
MIVTGVFSECSKYVGNPWPCAKIAAVCWPLVQRHKTADLVLTAYISCSCTHAGLRSGCCCLASAGMVVDREAKTKPSVKRTRGTEKLVQVRCYDAMMLAACSV